MIYFIPAWYKQNSWEENEPSWHVRRTKSENDDTVKQIQIRLLNHNIAGYGFFSRFGNRNFNNCIGR